MQGDVELGLTDDEQILAMGEKNELLHVCMSLVGVVLAIFFIGLGISFVQFELKNFDSVLNFFGFIILPILSIYLFYKCSESFRYNQIYITNKRIIITQKDRIEGIPFEEILYCANNLLQGILKLKSRRKFVFAYTNFHEVLNVIKNIYPNYDNSKYFKEKFFELLLGICLVIFLFFVIGSNNEYFNKFIKTESKSKLESTYIFDQEAYMDYLQKALKSQWNPPKLNVDSKVVVEFRVKPDGTVFEEKVLETSGSRDMDNSALFAIKSASPLKKLPDDLAKHQDVTINFTFDYNVIEMNENN